MWKGDKMPVTTEEIKKLLFGELDLMFDRWIINKIDRDLESSEEDWDYVLKIKLEPPNPFTMQRELRPLLIDKYYADDNSLP